jgi:hypothetical protein
MTSITHSVVSIQTSPQSEPSPPCWFGEVVIVAHRLATTGLLEAFAQQVRLSRAVSG